MESIVKETEFFWQKIMIKNDKKNRMNGRKMTIHPVFHSLNLSCSIKECKTVRADITVTDRMEKNQIQMII